MADLPAFATADDFADLLGLTLTNPETARATNLLARASNRIREAVDLQISLVDDDTYTRPGTTDKRITLPELPVVSVASVAIDGDAISDWYVAGDAVVRSGVNLVERVLIDGVVDGGYRWGAGFGCEQQTLTIVYTHGYSDAPEICRSIALEMVKRVWVNPGGVIQQTIADTQTTYAPYAEPPRGLALTSSERRELRRFFGSSAGAVWTGTAP